MGWQWVTDEMFDGKLDSLADALGIERLMKIPGVYERVKEELNNNVLEALAEEYERCQDCGSLTDGEGECPSCNEGKSDSV